MNNEFYFNLCKLMHKLAIRNGHIIDSKLSEAMWWVEQKLITDDPVCLVCKQKVCDADVAYKENNKLFEDHAICHAKEYNLLVLL